MISEIYLFLWYAVGFASLFWLMRSVEDVDVAGLLLLIVLSLLGPFWFIVALSVIFRDSKILGKVVIKRRRKG